MKVVIWDLQNEVTHPRYHYCNSYVYEKCTCFLAKELYSCIYEYMYMYTHKYTCTYMHEYAPVCSHMHEYTYMLICMYMHVLTFLLICVYMCFLTKKLHFLKPSGLKKNPLISEGVLLFGRQIHFDKGIKFSYFFTNHCTQGCK